MSQNLSLYRYRRTNKSFTEDLGAGVKLTLMLIPAGEFVMGAPVDESESRDAERPQHRVRVPQFLLGRFPVTQAQWRVVAGRELDPDPSRFKGDDRPVESIRWEDAQEFCRRLSRKTQKTYRLPSEVEWEYACRAGSVTPFHFGETITPEVANYNGDYGYNQGLTGENRGETTAVGIFPANDWGLHDMHGNVWEWCEDDWHDNYDGAPSDGSAWVDRSSTYKLVRGGSWFNDPINCRSACRLNYYVTYNDVGFRVVCEPPSILFSS